jgi:hypothetical protein
MQFQPILQKVHDNFRQIINLPIMLQNLQDKTPPAPYFPGFPEILLHFLQDNVRERRIRRFIMHILQDNRTRKQKKTPNALR